MSRTMRTLRKRRHRHQSNQALKFGASAKPRHTLKSGRTGKAHSVKLKSMKGGGNG